MDRLKIFINKMLFELNFEGVEKGNFFSGKGLLRKDVLIAFRTDKANMTNQILEQ